MATPGGAAETSDVADLPSPLPESRHVQRVYKVPPRQVTEALGVALSVGISAHGLISIAVCGCTYKACKVTPWNRIACLAGASLAESERDVFKTVPTVYP